MTEVVTTVHPLGGLGHFTEELGFIAWGDSKLAQRIPFGEWWQIQQEVLNNSENFIVSVHTGQKCVGGAVLLPTYDAQVGKALTLWHQFLRADLRGTYRVWREVIRQCIQCAQDYRYEFIVWTHRDESTGRFYLTHKEVSNHGKRSKGNH